MTQIYPQKCLGGWICCWTHNREGSCQHHHLLSPWLILCFWFHIKTGEIITIYLSLFGGDWHLCPTLTIQILLCFWHLVSGWHSFCTLWISFLVIPFLPYCFVYSGDSLFGPFQFISWWYSLLTLSFVTIVKCSFPYFDYLGHFVWIVLGQLAKSQFWRLHTLFGIFFKQ